MRCRINLLSIVFLGVLVSACNTGSTSSGGEIPDTSQVVKITPPENHFIVRKSKEASIPLAISFPDTTVNPFVNFNTATGKLEVIAGIHFSYSVSREPCNVQRMVDDVNSGIFAVSFLTKTDSDLVWRAALPDGSKAFYHFYCCRVYQNQNYVFRDNPAYDFTLQQVNLMLSYIQKTHFFQTKEKANPTEQAPTQ